MTETVVLIHGYAFDYRIWSPVELAFDGFHVIHLSLPGFGEEPVEEAYTMEQLAVDFWSEIDPHIAPKVHLVGHSMGGYVCMEMAAQQPARLKSLALVHSHVFADTASKKEDRTATLEMMSAHGRSFFVEKMIPSLFPDPDTYAEIIALLIRRGMRYDDKAWYFGTQAIRDRKDHTETLRHLHVPVLMILGEKDSAVPPELAFRQAHIPERVSFHLYPGTGHLAMYERTDRMITDLVRFYRSIGA